MYSKIKLFPFLLIYFILSTNIFASSIEIGTIPAQVCKYQKMDGSYAYILSDLHSVGRDDNHGGDSTSAKYAVWRSVYTFGIGQIEYNSTITSAYLYIECGYFNNIDSIRILSYSGDATNDNYEQEWEKSDDGYVYYGNISYGTRDTLPPNQNLAQDIQDLLDNGIYNISISVINIDEDIDRTYQDDITLKLVVKYLKPVDVTVKNSFGGGVFKFEGTQYNSGKKLENLMEGDSYSFENWDQTYDTTEYEFLNKWTNLTTGKVYYGNPANISFNNDATLQAEFARKLHITVKNRHNGGYVKVDSQSYPSGTSFIFPQNSQHDFEAWQQSYGGYYNVFKPNKPKWKDPQKISYYDSLLQNQVVTTDGNFVAQLWQRYDFHLNSDFIDGGNGYLKVDNNTISNFPYFQYIIEADSVKLEAPTQQHTVNGRTITYNLADWSDGNTDNPRNYSPTDHSSLVGRMKGNFVSNDSRATGYNNGRRIFKDNDGAIYVVYEDANDIWFTSSEDNGKTWNKETRVDLHNHASSSPSIAGTLDMLFVTWYDQTDYCVKMRKYNINTSQWYATHTVASVYFDDTIKPVPAIAVSEVVGGEYNIYISFNREKMSDDFQPTGISEIVLYKNVDQDYDEWNLILGPFDGSNPSLSYSAAGSNGYIGMVWDHDNKIYFKGTDYYGNWTSTKQISDDIWYHEDNCKPNISYTFGIAHIVWEGFHAITEMPTGYYRYYDVQNDVLSDLTEMPCGGADVYNLSVSTDQAYDSEHAYNYTVFYEADGIEKVDQTGNNFTQENFGDGKYPNITEHDRSRAVWTKYNDAPYFLKTDYVESNNGGGVSPIIINPGPVIDYVISANNNNGVEGDVTLSVENVILNHDTVYFDNALNSQTMSVSQNYVPLEMDLKVRFHNVNTGLNDEDILYNVVFKDSTDETFLTNLKYKELPSPNGNDFEKFLKVTTIVNLAGKTGKLHLKFNGVQPALVTKQLKVTGSGSLNKEISHKMIIPKTFALHQNFPNPFNPVTHITVDLPEDAKVHLSIYNVNGQKVKELMSGYKAAGTYEIIFDGKNLASGVYIYRLTTDKGFVQSKKMMLIR